jgi:peroxiredoxin
MILRTLAGVLLFFFLVFTSLAGEVTVYCKAKEYAGRDIAFNAISNQITGTEIELGRTKVDTGGNFSIQLNIDETLPIYIHLGVYRISFYAEPGAQYEIVLPPLQDKAESDYLNPYFKEVEEHAFFRNAKSGDLNTIMRMFDDSYGPYFEKFAQNMKAKDNPAILDSAIVSLMKPFTQISNKYFLDYSSYKLGMLRHMAYQFQSKAMSEQYFNKKPILYQNPAYMELFNQVYDKYFMYYIRTTEGKVLATDINISKSLFKLKSSLRQNNNFKNDSLLELVILKNLYDEFYSDRFSRSAILTIIDTIISSSKILPHRLIAQSIRATITRLLPGYEPPGFTLLNADSMPVNLSDLKGKYVYLCFCSCFSYACLKEFDMLERMNSKYAKYLQIVLISVDPKLSEMKSFVSKSDYKWTFLHFGKQPEILKEYDIRGYPTYFLLDKEGKLLLSPAPSPFENIELKLFELMRARGDI